MASGLGMTTLPRRAGDHAPVLPTRDKERRHGHAPNLDRVLVLHGGPLSESAPSTRGKGEVPCRRRAAGLITGSQCSLVPITSRVNLTQPRSEGRVVDAV